MDVRKLGLTLVAFSAVVYGACVDDSTNNGGPDASAPLDASVDVTTGGDTGTTSDAADAAGDVAADVATADAGDGGAGNDAADAADATDAATDAKDAADTGPGFDDAGCPLPTGVVVDPADAGLPATGLALWLRADMGLATLDGGAVCRWDDISGKTHPFAPGSATPPALDPTGIKGKPGVSFIGPNHHLYRPDVIGLAATSGRTIAAFGRTVDTTRRFQYFVQGTTGSAGTYFGLDANTFSTAGSREGVYVTNNAYDSNVATSANPRSHVFSISSFTPGGALPGVLAYAVDGVDTTLTRNAGGLGNGTVEDFSTANVTAIGAGVAGFTGAELGELLVYDHALTLAERLAVSQYFAARYP